MTEEPIDYVTRYANRFKDWTAEDFEKEARRVERMRKHLEDSIPKLKRAMTEQDQTNYELLHMHISRLGEFESNREYVDFVRHTEKAHPEWCGLTRWVDAVARENVFRTLTQMEITNKVLTTPVIHADTQQKG